MSTRLQVLLDEEELKEIRAVARRHRMTTSEWVRQSLRRVRAEESTADVQTKQEALRRSVRHQFPTGGIDQMLAEIEQGYSGGGS